MPTGPVLPSADDTEQSARGATSQELLVATGLVGGCEETIDIPRMKLADRVDRFSSMDHLRALSQELADALQSRRIQGREGGMVSFGRSGIQAESPVTP